MAGVRFSGFLIVGVAVLGVAAERGRAQTSILVDLEFDPPVQAVQVGDTVKVRLRAFAQEAPGQLVSSITMILVWDPSVLRLCRVVPVNEYNWLVSAFPCGGLDIDDLNGPCSPGDCPNRWGDGDGFYVALGQFPPFPRPFIRFSGLHVCTFEFRALAADTSTMIEMAPKRGESQTVVFDGNIPNNTVTGELFSAEVRVVDDFFGDFDRDGDVDQVDLAAFGTCFTSTGGFYTDPDCAAGDYDEDQDIDLADYSRHYLRMNGPR